MPLQFTTPRRRTVRRRHVNHRNPTTLREKYIAGFEVMGYTKQQTRSQRYAVYQKDGEKNYYIGDNGALRVGSSTTNSIPASDVFKELIITAPDILPLVKNWLETGLPPVDSDPVELVGKFILAHDEPPNINPKIIKRHITTWLREKDQVQ